MHTCIHCTWQTTHRQCVYNKQWCRTGLFPRHYKVCNLQVDSPWWSWWQPATAESRIGRTNAGGEQSKANWPELHERTVVPHSRYWCELSTEQNCRIAIHQLGNSDTAIFIPEYISGRGAIIILDLVFKNFPDVPWQSLYWDLALHLANVYIGMVNTVISLTNWSHCTTSHTTSTTLWYITHGTGGCCIVFA